MGEIVKMENEAGISEQKREAILRFINPNNSLDSGEVELFLHLCMKTGLDPLLKQIYAIPKRNNKLGRDVLTVVISIDAFRLVAERTGCYAPGSATQYSYDEKGRLAGATAFVKKMTADGTWHEVSESALMSEYCSPNNHSWRSMPHVMISKVAEARALRRAFPDRFGGLYGKEEMDQAQEYQNDGGGSQKTSDGDLYIDESQVIYLKGFLHGKEELKKQLLQLCKASSLDKILKTQAEACKQFIKSKSEAQDES